MKNLFTIAMALVVMTFATSCDLINDATEQTVSICNIELDLDKLTTSVKSSSSYTFISQDVTGDYTFSGALIPESLLSTLDDEGARFEISASDYPEGVPEMTIEITMGGVSILEDNTVISSSNKSTTGRTLTSSEFNAITSASDITYNVHFAESSFEADLSEVSTITVSVKIIVQLDIL